MIVGFSADVYKRQGRHRRRTGAGYLRERYADADFRPGRRTGADDDADDGQSIVGIGININQEEFHSSAPNPVSLRQITQKETDRMAVLNSVLEHIINLYSRIENRETDICLLYTSRCV